MTRFEEIGTDNMMSQVAFILSGEKRATKPVASIFEAVAGEFKRSCGKCMNIGRCMKYNCTTCAIEQKFNDCIELMFDCVRTEEEAAELMQLIDGNRLSNDRIKCAYDKAIDRIWASEP